MKAHVEIFVKPFPVRIKVTISFHGVKIKRIMFLLLMLEAQK